MSKDELPQTLIEAIRLLLGPRRLHRFRGADCGGPNGPVCPRCGGIEHSYLTTRRAVEVQGAASSQFSVKVGTIFEDSPLGLDKWLPAVWLIANSKNGITSHELGRSLGVTQKSAWFMLHRIRLAMQTGTLREAVAASVEVDETFIGGKAANMHKARPRRRRISTGRVATTRQSVLGMRGARRRGARRGHPRHQAPRPLKPRVRENGRGGQRGLHGRAQAPTSGLDADYEHEIVDHAESTSMGNVHTNGIENFWSLLKRGLHGTYISVEPFHLFRYVDERAFTFNLRDLTDLGRFATLLGQVSARRLTYAELTGKA